MKHLLYMNIFFIIHCVSLDGYTRDFTTERPITIAILAKDKAATLPLYLSCLERQTWPKAKTYLYIRTNDNNDTTAEILKNWIAKVQDKYLGIYFDDSDAPINVKQYKGREWNYTRFKVLGKIRQESVEWAYAHNSHYFIADCDNFILPHTIETMLYTNLPIIAPLLHSNSAYSNYHADIDQNGYHKDSSFYLPLLNREIKGHVEVPVVHCTYFIRYEVLAQMSYDDESCRYEYVIFSDNARKKEIPQYLDTTDVFGYVTFAESAHELIGESWLLSFIATLNAPRL